MSGRSAMVALKDLAGGGYSSGRSVVVKLTDVDGALAVQWRSR